MCELCDPITREAAVASHRRTSDKLLQLSRYYEGLASGRIEPHNESSISHVKHAARSMIRHLVDEWV